MIAVNWEQIGDVSTISIQDLIPGTTEGLVVGANSGASDYIMVWDPSKSGYDTYYLYKNPRGNTPARDYKWNFGTSASDKRFGNGDAFWFYHRGDQDVTIALKGQVDASATQDIPLVNGYNMIGSAFPANFNPNSLGAAYWQTAVANGAVAGANSGSADTIMVWSPENNGYTTYYLYKNPRGNTPARDYKWNIGTAAAADDAELVPPAHGAWYYHRGSGFTMVAPTPLSAD